MPFKGTLLLTTCFGVIAGFASSFAILCLCFFGLGLGVGGSMPTDGTVFLENLPEEHHYLLTALSVFFSLGSILTSTLAVAIVPSRSCPEGRQAPCDVATQNTGWRLLLGALSILTLLFFSLRLFFFRLHESAKYVSHQTTKLSQKLTFTATARYDWTVGGSRAGPATDC